MVGKVTISEVLKRFSLSKSYAAFHSFLKGDEYELKLNIFICTSKKCAEYLMPGYEEVFPSHDFQLTFQIRAEDDARNDFW